MGTGEFNAVGVTLQWSNIPSRKEVEIPLVTSLYRKGNKLQPDAPLDSYADLTLTN